MGKCLHSDLNDGVLRPLNCSFMHMINVKPSGGESTQILYSISNCTNSLTLKLKNYLQIPDHCKC